MRFPKSIRSSVSIASVALIAAVLAGCHSGNGSSGSASDTTSLPPASTLLSQAETAMGAVQSVHFTLNVDGTIAALPVKSANGVLTHAGDAKGTATAVEFGTTLEIAFVIVGDSFYFKGPTGGYQKLPLATATTFYDPSAILDPNRGIPKVLSDSQNAKTVGSTTINGATAYEVSLTPDPDAIKSLLPGVGSGVTASIWIDKASGHVVKGVFNVPNNGKKAVVTITLDSYDQPVSISAP
ncbi:MAG TPA: LppX_LprAFG lipoprotein [Micromonosporaceae bacterium]|jgi:lipoprotein LprG